MTGMKKKILSLVLAMGLTLPVFASIGVAPTRIEINANKIKSNYVTTALEIKGDSYKPTRYKAYTGYFTIGKNGDVNIEANPADIYNFSKKLRFVPSEFTVAQNKSQKLRINVTNLNQLPDGENRAILYIEDINPREMNIPTGQSGVGAQLIVKTRVGVPIYIDKNVTKSADVEYINIVRQKDGLYSDMKVVSKGNARVRYNAKFQILQGKNLITEYDSGERTVGGNNEYTLKLKVPTKNLKNGEQYTMRVVISYFDEKGKKKHIKKEVNFNMQGNV